MERVKRQFWWSVGVMGIILAALLAFGAYYIALMLDKQNLQTARYLSHVAVQSRNTVAKQVEGDFQTLEALAVVIGRQPETDVETLLETLEEINDQNAFIRMGYVDMQGMGYIVDISGKQYVGVDLHDRPYIQKALAGEAYVSDALEDRLDGEWGNCYGVPIRREGRVVGALCAVNNISALCDSMNGFLNDSSGFVYIITGDGELVMPAAHPDADPAMRSIYELSFAGDADEQRLKQDLLKGETGYFSFDSTEGIAYWASYVQAGVKDWYVVSVIPKSQVNSGFIQVVRLSIIVFLLTVGLFLLLLFYNYKTMQRSRNSILRMAYYDTLTGAYNKNKFIQEAGKLLRQTNRRYMLVALDIRNFKFINEIYGFEKGDLVLRHVKQVLERQVGENEAFYRGNAERFGALLLYEDEQGAVERVGRIMRAVDEYSLKEGQKSGVVCRCGIKVISPEEQGEELDLRLDRAFMALQRAKEQPGQRYAFFDDELSAWVNRKKYIENHMEEALERQEFQVHFQPKFSLESGRIAGAEALTRWRNAEGGQISPNEFIPVFEQNGFILRLDQYVLDEVCRRLRSWLDAGMPVTPVSVNQSRRLLYQPDYVRTLEQTLERHGISPALIVLEITESIAMENLEAFKRVVSRLHGQGFRISMDDFGSGYSSLNVLKDIPVDELKLDRVFLSSAKDEARRDTIVRHVIRLAEDLGITTVSEGVETDEQVAFLRACGCDIAQGFYFAKPMPPEELENRLLTTGVEQAPQMSPGGAAGA